MCVVRGQLGRVSSLLHYMSSRNQTQVMRAGSKHLYPLSPAPYILMTWAPQMLSGSLRVKYSHTLYFSSSFLEEEKKRKGKGNRRIRRRKEEEEDSTHVRSTMSCRPGWPLIDRDLPTSASTVLGLKACATTTWLFFF